MKKIAIFKIALAAFVISSASPAVAEKQAKQGDDNLQAANDRDARLKWWREAKFGMFVHWGVYSVTGGEYRGQKLPNSAEWMMNRGKIPIAEYEEYATQFNPTKFDATTFVKRAKDAGMKYLVITAKHHDGFAMFDSSSNPFNVVKATPFKRDIMKELAAACQKQGIRFGFYYSQAQDWHHPGGFGNSWDKSIRRVSSDEYVREKAVPEVKQLLTKYGPIAIFWWDTPRKMSQESFKSLHSLTAIQPNIITNDRLGESFPGDYKTFERHIPKQAPTSKDWEVCMPISGSWGYKRSDRDFKSTSKLIHNLVDIASKGGNYLLNVSPTGNGELLPEAVERLEEIGDWMKVNGDSIYGTTASPLPELAWGRCTKKVATNSTRLYLHVFDWPEDETLHVPGITNPVNEVYLLSNGHKLQTQESGSGLTISLPGSGPDDIDTVIVVDMEGVLEIKSGLPSFDSDGQLVLEAKAAYLHNNEGSTQIRLQERVDSTNIGYWTDDKAWIEWAFKVDRPGTYSVTAEIAIDEPTTRFFIGLPGQLLRVEAASTGDYYTYEEKRLGTIRINQSGEQSFQIKPDEGHWNPINLRRVILNRLPFVDE